MVAASYFHVSSGSRDQFRARAEHCHAVHDSQLHLFCFPDRLAVLLVSGQNTPQARALAAQLAAMLGGMAGSAAAAPSAATPQPAAGSGGAAAGSGAPPTEGQQTEEDEDEELAQAMRESLEDGEK